MPLRVDNSVDQQHHQRPRLFLSFLFFLFLQSVQIVPDATAGGPPSGPPSLLSTPENPMSCPHSWSQDSCDSTKHYTQIQQCPEVEDGAVFSSCFFFFFFLKVKESRPEVPWRTITFHWFGFHQISRIASND